MDTTIPVCNNPTIQDNNPLTVCFYFSSIELAICTLNCRLNSVKLFFSQHVGNKSVFITLLLALEEISVNIYIYINISKWPMKSLSGLPPSTLSLKKIQIRSILYSVGTKKKKKMKTKNKKGLLHKHLSHFQLTCR